MTADQVIKKMKLNNEANNWDLIYNWIRQGEIQAKTFKKVMNELTKPKEIIQNSTNKYEKEKEEAQIKTEKFLKTSSKKKAS